MATRLRAPGVYIEEVSGGPKPIQAVGTSTAGFVGVAPNATAHLNQAVPIDNWTEFLNEFVLGGKTAATSTDLSNGVYGFFLNGGQRCYVVNVGMEKNKANPITGSGTERAGLDLLARIDEVAIVAAPGYTDAASYQALINHCLGDPNAPDAEPLRDRVAILDCLGPDDKTFPADVTLFGEVRNVTDEEPAEGERVGVGPGKVEDGFATLYFPWIYVRDPLSGKPEPVAVPPSGFVAGVWARTDATRGVHKAPANEVVRGALGVSYTVTRGEQAQLNADGVNVIRFFPDEGIRIWGARTLSDDPEWRYLNVRRLFNMINESIQQGMRWVVFEPNDMTLWKSIQRDVGAFLFLLWQDGALMGESPDQAFYVKCDAETNPQARIDAGEVTTEIGIAPVKPAEFVIFRISQNAGGSEVAVAAGGSQ